jgi:RIO kinase 1
MRVPEALEPLVEQGVIDEVLRPLMAGKEAQIYLVVAQGHLCVAKVYKDATNRSFKHRSTYVEGRKSRDSRSERAMTKGSKFGKAQLEEQWKSAEVEAIHKLRAADVRVPEPYSFSDGVLLMELVMNADGDPAPRLADIAEFTEEEARWVFDCLLGDIVRMLCAGLVHGDLSDFNVLIAHDGPVIIDFPQATDAARNNNSQKLLVRDVDNVVAFMSRFLPELQGLEFGREMWDLYERGTLRPDTRLTGTFQRSTKAIDTDAILREIEDAAREARAKREALGLPPPRPARAPVVYETVAVEPRGKKKGRGGGQPQPQPQQERKGGGGRGGARTAGPEARNHPQNQPRNPPRGERQETRSEPRGERQAPRNEPQERRGGGQQPRGQPHRGAPRSEEPMDDLPDDLDDLLTVG